MSVSHVFNFQAFDNVRIQVLRSHVKKVSNRKKNGRNEIRLEHTAKKSQFHKLVNIENSRNFLMPN